MLELLHSLGSALHYAWAFLFVIFVIVFFHEMGHFLVARMLGVRVEAFSIGFGPEVFGWNDKRQTRWKVCLFPVGGFVKFYGDGDETSSTSKPIPPIEALPTTQAQEQIQVQAGGLLAQPWSVRLVIALAGPLANFILSIVIWTLIFSLVGVAIFTPIIVQVLKDSPAEKAGLMVGDRILSVDGKVTEDFSSVAQDISTKAGQTVALGVARGQQVITVSIVPEKAEGRAGPSAFIGIIGKLPQTASQIHYKRQGLFKAFVMANQETYRCLQQLGSFFWGLLTHAEGTDGIGGPVRIAQLSGQAADFGAVALFQLIALLSISIGFINLLPIPLLDGGHVLYALLEGVRGKPVGERIQSVGLMVGSSVLILLFAIAIWNDVSSLGSFKWLAGLLHRS